MKRFFIIGFSLLAFHTLEAQKKNVSLEDIWKNNVFASKSVSGLVSMKDGIHYSTTLAIGKDNCILRSEYATTKAPDTLARLSNFKIDSYEFSADENKILLSTDQEQIYRHSTKAHYFVYDRKTKVQTPISTDKIMYAHLSPDGNKIAWVNGNNLFMKDLLSGKETQMTNDGKFNAIINGANDWVYEEEFSFSESYCWSPDSKKIAYYKFDESNVKEFSFDEFNQQLYPNQNRYKYPKAGEDNSIVSIHAFDITSASDKLMDVGSETNQYIPRIKWTADANTLSILRMNRLQNKLDLLLADATTGTTKIIYSETSDTYLNIHEGEGDYVFFTNDNKYFIIQSEKDGFNHLYLYDMTGKLVNQITKGNWEVVKFKGIDEKAKTIFYTCSESNAMDKDIYSIKLDGTNKKKVSAEQGVHDAAFSVGMKFYIDTYSNANAPSIVTIRDAKGKMIRILEDNQALMVKMQEYNLSQKEFFKFTTSENVSLNGWMIKPPDFNPNKKYPVFMVFYGGPGSNLVNNSFDGKNYFWHQLLAEKEYIVVCVDNRGTKFRGRDFMHCTYKQLGKLEVADQIETAKYMGSLPYVDKSRIGTWGWSFGGYLSALCITKGADYFKMAISVAPVTNWRYYDNIYTERFMGLPKDNASGYDDNSPINHVSKLKGKYLLIHGSGDDNVHYQNSMEMISALVAANKQFDLFIYPDKAHSIMGGNTRLHLYTKMTNFILENL